MSVDASMGTRMDAYGCKYWYAYGYKCVCECGYEYGYECGLEWTELDLSIYAGVYACVCKIGCEYENVSTGAGRTLSAVVAVWVLSA